MNLKTISSGKFFPMKVQALRGGGQLNSYGESCIGASVSRKIMNFKNIFLRTDGLYCSEKLINRKYFHYQDQFSKYTFLSW